MTERMIDSNGIRLWTEDFGDPNDPTLLLVMGASAQGIQWPEPFIEAFVARGFYVIRYDNRDTGQSTCFDFATSPYTLDDLANDAVGVLDAYGVRAAHVAGASMGGMITQTLMIRYPHRLKSATIIMSSPLAASTACRCSRRRICRDRTRAGSPISSRLSRACRARPRPT